MSRSSSRFSLARLLSLESILPEQRVFLRSAGGTRYLRLRPWTRLGILAGGFLILSWAIIATTILVIDATGAGTSRDQFRRAQMAFEQRLTDLVAERDIRAAEAITTQERFAAALDQVSAMQAQLLDSEQRRQELESNLSVTRRLLQTTQAERDQARDDAERLATTLESGADNNEVLRTQEYSVALDIVSQELETTAESLDKAETESRRLAVERDTILARNDAILSQIENAMVISTEPLDQMFRSIGVNPDDLLASVRSGYSGTGGPLTPMAYSTHGDATISATEIRASKILVSIDEMNSYSIAIGKVPVAMPIKAAFRYSSPFGRRWGRMHSGVDMAAPTGTAAHVTADGVVTYAGWMRGYGNIIKVQHEQGLETRYAHLSKIHVSKGQRVSRGMHIGDIGNTGRSTGPHLHYEVRVNGSAVDPMIFIKAADNVF